MKLFQLTFWTLFARKTWLLALGAVCGVPFLVCHFSAGAENPALLKPAIAQASWGMAWLMSGVWLMFAAASLGSRHVESALCDYLVSRKQSKTRQLCGLWAAVSVYAVPLAAGAALCAILGASPADPEERRMWVVLNLQYAGLMLLVVSPLSALALATASRCGGIIGFVLPLSLMGYGWYGVGFLRDLAETSAVVEALVEYSPHYYIADLAPRLRYKMGAISWDFLPKVAGYFAGVAVVIMGLARMIFRVRSTH